MDIRDGLFEFLGIIHNTSQSSKKGYRPEQEGWDGSELKKMKKIEPAMNKQAIRLFDEFLLHCNTSNIKVIMVNSPMYYEATLKLVNKDSLNALINYFSKKYNIPYLDYTNNPICFDTA